MLRTAVSAGDVLIIKRKNANNTLKLVFSSVGYIEVKADSEMKCETEDEEKE